MKAIDLDLIKETEKQTKLNKKFYRKFVGRPGWIDYFLEIEVKKIKSKEKTLNLVQKVYNLNKEEAEKKALGLMGTKKQEYVYCGDWWEFHLRKAKKNGKSFYMMHHQGIPFYD